MVLNRRESSLFQLFEMDCGASEVSSDAVENLQLVRQQEGTVLVSTNRFLK